MATRILRDPYTNKPFVGFYTTKRTGGMLADYRISGCLGLNSDAAWGGIDGGISIPKCRNDLPRLWNDYEVEEGGSVIVRTYHRPHPDAPTFARNEIEDYSNGDLIDIPRDVFVSVRVQMPEHEEPKPKIMHSNVYCGTV